MRVTVLGCGTSSGVPQIGCDCAVCRSNDPRNKRLRCSILIESKGQRILVDTGPDLRQQCLSAGIGAIDALIYTHAHADHVHGIDDLRQIVFNMEKRLPVWADAPTQDALISRFAYAFVQPEGSPYPPILDLHSIESKPFEINGAAGPIRFEPIEVDHGSMDALGFRIGGLAYVPDVVRIPDAAWAQLDGLDVWIIDALRRKPHPTHAHLAMTLEWIARAKPLRSVITNMHLDMDFATLTHELPTGVSPAFDGMVLHLDTVG